MTTYKIKINKPKQGMNPSMHTLLYCTKCVILDLSFVTVCSIFQYFYFQLHETSNNKKVPVSENNI